jgi:hypothetical protein
MTEELVTLKVDSHRDVPENFTGIVLWPSGSKQWFKNGQLHRVDGPANEYDYGRKEWWVNGNRHREDGPAVEWEDGTHVWYWNGDCIACDDELLLLKGNYIAVERGIPTGVMFGELKLTKAKLLTAEGTVFVWDNLPGMEPVQ